MKIWLLLGVFILGLIFGVIFSHYFFKTNVILKLCPDEWIVNNQPGTDKLGEEYFILQGRRIEIFELDAEWIKSNCEIEKTIVV